MNTNKTEGAWIFISHSNKDIKKVREIRNELERQGHNPIMFFLKSLNDDSELDDLIRREISARNWFILCDSINARKSKWVQAEIEIIKNMAGKVYESISLEKDIQTQMGKIKTLSKRATVFLSYARKDVDIARRICVQLQEEDYRVFLDLDSLSPGEDWRVVVSTALDQAVSEGFVLVLLSPDSFSSQWSRHDFLYALTKSNKSTKSNIVPIIIRDSTIVFSQLPPELAKLQCIDMSCGDFEESMQKLIDSLKTREME